MDRKQIETVIKIYLKDLGKKIKIEKAILFGSAARGGIGNLLSSLFAPAKYSIQK